MGLALLLHTTEERLFHLLQHVEADKEIAIVFEIDVFTFGHLPIECTFIGQALFLEFGIETLVDVMDMTP